MHHPITVQDAKPLLVLMSKVTSQLQRDRRRSIRPTQESVGRTVVD
jgi:hypothetical protein